MAYRIWAVSLSLMLLLLFTGMPATASGIEIAGTAGYGLTDGDDQRRSGTAGFGASVLWPASSRHALQFDYTFTDFRSRFYDRHFVTGSYILQGRGTTRPFLQFGAGAVVTRGETRVFRISETDFTFLIGAGVTIDASPRIFIRPHIRSYLYAGPTLTVIPSMTLGWRF